MKEVFPDYLDKFDLPKIARKESIKVYRACRSGKCDNESFLPSFEEKGCDENLLSDPKDPSEYSLSTYEKPKDIKRFASLTSDMKVPYRIAIGETKPQYGLVQRTKERKPGYKSSHVDWRLYKDATPYKAFKIIDNFEKYYENYKQGKTKNT
ncbi:MAG: hypothetical protein ACTTH8_03575 [Treponema sp.]